MNGSTVTTGQKSVSSNTLEETSENSLPIVISGFRRDVAEICALLGYYAALSGSSVLSFQENLSVPSSRIKKFFLGLPDPKMGPIGSPETSIQNHRSTLRNIPEERRSQLHRGVSLKSRIYCSNSNNDYYNIHFLLCFLNSLTISISVF